MSTVRSGPRRSPLSCALAKHPKVLVKVGAFYALGKKKPPYLDLGPMIQSVVKAFGAEGAACGKPTVRSRSTGTSTATAST